MEWTLEGVRAAGFEGFVHFADLPASNVPSQPGVYVILWASEDQPDFRERSVGGWFKGKDPSVPAESLRARWVAGTPVVYIGKATAGRSLKRGIRRRLEEFRRFGAGEAVGHWGGRYVWQIADTGMLLVAWKVVTDRSPTDVEAELIRSFVDTFGVLPFANIRHERRGRSSG